MKRVLAGSLLLIALALLDILFNVLLVRWTGVVPGLMSLGILIAAVIFVNAVHRDKVFDLVTIAHQDVIDTIAIGILVLDDGNRVVEINKAHLPHINLRLGDRFDMEAFLKQGNIVNEFQTFLHTYIHRPLDLTEFQAVLRDGRYINLQAAPILAEGHVVGRTITFQDVSELRRLIDQTHRQNEILRQLAITDGLTGCYNRRYLTSRLENEVTQNVRSQTPFALLLLDIDFFKSVKTVTAIWRAMKCYAAR